MNPIKIIKTSVSDLAIVRFWSLSFLVGGLVFCYGFLLIGTTVASGDVRSTDNEITKVKTEIASLEVEYFTSVSKISTDDVSRLNMKEPTDTQLTYIDLGKKTSELVLR
jgi:hypothetical protein